MDSSDIGYLIGIFICVVCSGFFSASETAYTTLNRIRMRNAADAGDQRAKLVLAVSDNYDRLLSTILIGNNIVNIASASLATVFFTRLVGGEAGVTVSTAVMTVIVLIFGEISPKSIAKERPDGFARFAAPIFKVLISLLSPLNFLFMQWKKLLMCIFKKPENIKMTQEELRTIVDEACSDGGIDEENGVLLTSALEFDDLDAGDILTPRVDVVAVDEDTPFEEIADIFLENTYSRLPVFSDSIDNIIGMVHEKDYFSALHKGMREIAPIIKKVVYVSGGMKISDLLRSLQKSKLHMAVIVDEFGGTEGIVTMEDIIEELVGDIWDEHDVVIDYFKKQDDGTYLVDCGADLEDFFEEFGMEEPEDEYESVTVGGWVMEHLGKIPAVGDFFEAHGMSARVTEISGHHATEICVDFLADEIPEAAQA